MNPRVRPAVTGDLAAVTALEAACFCGDERWGDELWRPEFEHPAGAAVFVAQACRTETGDGCEAYDDVVAAACFHLAGRTAELYRVMTAPAWRGLGVATLLLARGFTWARSRGATEMLLEVRVGNGAQALYSDAGFAPLYRRTNYYGPGLDAWVMRRPLDAVSDDVKGEPR